MPSGWEMKVDPQHKAYFVDHKNKISTYDDPRIPKLRTQPPVSSPVQPPLQPPLQPSQKRNVVINGAKLNDTEVGQLEKLVGMVIDGDYW